MRKTKKERNTERERERAKLRKHSVDPSNRKLMKKWCSIVFPLSLAVIF